MIHLFQPIEDFVIKLAKPETDPINQARVKMLLYILILYLPFTGILIVAYSIGGQTPHLIRVSTVFIASLVLISAIYYTRAWRLASHISLCLLTLAVWTNLSIYVQGINVETLQFIWFACALSFYMHGLKWGWFYSAINVLPVIIYTGIDSKNYFYLGSGPHEVNQATYLFVTAYNFLLIIYLHYYFFKAFNRNFINLTKTKNELNELNEKLSITLSDLKKVSNARMEFLSTMSHELRTPLNGVIGISNALLLQDPREDQEENLSVLKFSAENLLLLVNNILDFNKFDSDKVEMEHIAFDLITLLKNNHSSLKLKAQEKMLDLKLTIAEELEGKIIVGDPTRLTQVLLNLLNNAIKFTETGYVALSTHTIDTTEDQITIRFTIEDTGIGVEPDKQQHIFEPFIQASTSTSRHYGGTGLGLPIVKKVLKMFNSDIKVVSTVNTGAKFFFDITFPYFIADATIIHKPVDTKNELAHLKVLVAEDNPVNILVIKKTLEQWNIVPTIAENGLFALQKLEEGDFDVILMDLYMPEMDGYEVAETIRSLSNKRKAGIHIIALTASVNHNVADRVKKSGMNDYLSKPFDPHHLFQKLKRMGIEAPSYN
ncbi:MAG: response regulator [Candidatus Pedobacter colombiensis]|uniref:histidine kinase n=1 Tax=Candidatus Pedobacter colombiensis TaxID=3121371 RepID=A0AAJ5W3D0_9SPHI|nr:response regulator [Pedobacter sp.]WEK17753.1 MAG: response regulator [Pedobacter sp.]